MTTLLRINSLILWGKMLWYVLVLIIRLFRLNALVIWLSNKQLKNPPRLFLLPLMPPSISLRCNLEPWNVQLPAEQCLNTRLWVQLSERLKNMGVTKRKFNGFYGVSCYFDGEKHKEVAVDSGGSMAALSQWDRTVYLALFVIQKPWHLFCLMRLMIILVAYIF